MSKYCPMFGLVLYLDCLDCDTKYCRGYKDKLCWTCKYRIKIASNYRCKFTHNNLNNEKFMRSECNKYEQVCDRN